MGHPRVNQKFIAGNGKMYTAADARQLGLEIVDGMGCGDL